MNLRPSTAVAVVLLSFYFLLLGLLGGVRAGTCLFVPRGLFGLLGLLLLFVLLGLLGAGAAAAGAAARAACAVAAAGAAHAARLRRLDRGSRCRRRCLLRCRLWLLCRRRRRLLLFRLRCRLLAPCEDGVCLVLLCLQPKQLRLCDQLCLRRVCLQPKQLRLCDQLSSAASASASSSAP